MSQLDELQKLTTIVADTGEFEEIKKFKPTDATTNPSLIFKASSMPEYQFLIEDALEYGRKGNTKEEKLERALGVCEFWPRDPENRPRSSINRGGCPPLLRYRREHRKSSPPDRSV